MSDSRQHQHRARFTARDVRGGLRRLVQHSKGRWGPSTPKAPQRPVTAPAQASTNVTPKQEP